MKMQILNEHVKDFVKNKAQSIEDGVEGNKKKCKKKQTHCKINDYRMFW